MEFNMQSSRNSRFLRTNRIQIVLLLPLLAFSAELNAQSPSPGDVATRLKQLRGQLAPFFHPPAEFAGDFGKYKSPLVFDDGRPVKTAEDWRLRRAEILKTWHTLMGPWPPLVEKPTIEYLEKESHDKYTQQRIRVQVAPDRTSDDAYLLVPEGAGRFRP